MGTDEHAMSLALRAEVPEIQWPLDSSSQPSTLAVLDLVEFCARAVAAPIQGSLHPYFRHHHLQFDRDTGRAEFRSRINRLFARNGLALELQENGQVTRLGPPVLRDALASAIFRTGDRELDTMLETARLKFMSPSQATRREGLEKLWDAWERLKTIEAGSGVVARTPTLAAGGGCEEAGTDTYRKGCGGDALRRAYALADDDLLELHAAGCRRRAG